MRTLEISGVPEVYDTGARIDWKEVDEICSQHKRNPHTNNSKAYSWAYYIFVLSNVLMSEKGNQQIFKKVDRLF